MPAYRYRLVSRLYQRMKASTGPSKPYMHLTCTCVDLVILAVEPAGATSFKLSFDIRYTMLDKSGRPMTQVNVSGIVAEIDVRAHADVTGLQCSEWLAGRPSVY